MIHYSVDREPGKRKCKASKSALIDLAQLEMGDSSDDSDFNVDEAKLNEDDDISINSDPGISSEEESEENSEEESIIAPTNDNTDGPMSVQELIERAHQNKIHTAVKVSDFLCLPSFADFF